MLDVYASNVPSPYQPLTKTYGEMLVVLKDTLRKVAVTLKPMMAKYKSVKDVLPLVHSSMDSNDAVNYGWRLMVARLQCADFHESKVSATITLASEM